MTDLRLAFRQLFRRPGFSAAVILTLALGTGANTAIFSLVHSVLLRPLPYPEADRLVRIASVNPALGFTDSRSSPLNVLDWQRQNKVFESIAAFQEWDGILTYRGKSATARVNWVTPNLLPMLGLKPFLGELLPDGETPQSGIMLPYGLWRSQFGGDPSVVGRSVTEDGVDSRVAGILPPDAAAAAPAQGALETDQAFVRMNLPRVEFPRSFQLFNVVGRLKPGITVEQAQADLSSVAARLEETYPDTNRGWGVRVTDLKSWMTAPIRGQLWAVYGATAIILLMACLNVSNLLLIRGAARHKELAIRCALGSSRLRLIRQMLIESLLLALAGGLTGMFVAALCHSALTQFAPQSLPLRGSSPFAWPVIISAAATSLLAAILFGFFPALRLSRANLNRALSEASRGATASKSRHRTLGFLVAGQIAISTILLVAAGLIIMSFRNLLRVDPGIARSGTLFFRVAYIPDRPTGERLMESLSAVPGVEAVGGSHIEALNDVFANPVRITIDGKLAADGAASPTVNFWLATKGYFSAAGIRLISGRAFETQDSLAETAIINEALARRYFPKEDPIGKVIRIASDDKNKRGSPHKIIGVVGSVHQRGLREDAVPVLYAHYTDFATGGLSMAVRTKQDPRNAIPALREAIRKVNPELVMSRIGASEDVIARSLADQRFATQLMFAFAGLGTSLAAIGLYGVLAYAVSQRTKEFGIRIALGARAANILQMILRQGMTLTVLGLAAGLLGSLALGKALRSLLFNVSPTDPATFATIALFLGIVTLFACWVPAHRATRIDPMTALREE